MALSMDKPYIFFEDVPDAAGNPRQFQTTKLKFIDAAGRLCTLGICQDVTDLVRIQRENATTKEAYEKKLEAKFRRAYVTYNNAFQKGQKLQKQLDETKEKAKNSHEHALALKEKNLRLQEKVTQLNARNVELKGKLKDARHELNEVYSQSLIETVRNWRKGRKEHEKQDS
jgi:uncharacterized protein YlxW (UPF0749 family)